MYSISAMMCKKTTIKSNVGLLQTIKLFKLTCNLMNIKEDDESHWNLLTY